MWWSFIVGNILYYAVGIMLAFKCKDNRAFCKYVCPLGAFYGLFQRFSFYHMEVDASRCDHCGACEKICPMGVEVTKNINSPECIRCGQCKSVCHTDAISAGFVLGCGGSCKTCKKENEA